MTHPRDGLRPPPLKGAPLADRRSRIRGGGLVANVPKGTSLN